MQIGFDSATTVRDLALSLPYENRMGFLGELLRERDAKVEKAEKSASFFEKTTKGCLIGSGISVVAVVGVVCGVAGPAAVAAVPLVYAGYALLAGAGLSKFAEKFSHDQVSNLQDKWMDAPAKTFETSACLTKALSVPAPSRSKSASFSM